MLQDKNFKKVLFYSILFLTLIFIWSISTGRYDLNIISVFKIIVNKILNRDIKDYEQPIKVLKTLRIPRAVGALLVGASLSISGGTYQGVFKNPLVSPNLLGVSAGAAVGSGIAILLNKGILGIQIFSFLGGIIAVYLTAKIPELLRNASDLMLVLTGIIISGVMNSIMGIIKYVADSETQLPAITYWQMGSLARISEKDILILGPIMVVSIGLLILLSWKINILSLGDKEAQTLGVNVKKLRKFIIILSTLLTASSVSIAGTIGWIGLVIPHFTRIIIGPDNTKMLPLSTIFGAIFLILVDTLARGISASEIPISILTGLIGAPLYLYLLVKQGTDLR